MTLFDVSIGPKTLYEGFMQEYICKGYQCRHGSEGIETSNIYDIRRVDERLMIKEYDMKSVRSY